MMYFYSQNYFNVCCTEIVLLHVYVIVVVTIADVQVAGIGVSLWTLAPEAANGVYATAVLTQSRHKLALINVYNKQH